MAFHLKNLIVASCLIALVAICFPRSDQGSLIAQTPPTRIKPLIRAKPLKPAQQAPSETKTEEQLQDAIPSGVSIAPPQSGTTPAAAKTLTAQQREQQLQVRLKKLNTLKLSRLPSGIFESWSNSDTVQSDLDNDFPPAPSGAILQSDARFNLAVEKFKSDFALGNWSELREFLKLLPKQHAILLYRNMLTAVSVSVRTLPGNREANSRTDPRALQSPYLTFEDIFEIAAIRPVTDDKPLLPLYAKLFSTVIARGASVQDLVRLLHEKSETAERTIGSTGERPDRSTTDPSEDPKPLFTRRNVALILMLAKHPMEAGEFLPELEDAKKMDDHEALNLISRFYLAKYEEESETEQLENAWQVTQAILASESVDQEERKQALQRAVELSGKVRKELGEKWLDDTFGTSMARGVETLAGIGSDVSRNLIRHPMDPGHRHKQLELQSHAVRALLGRKKELQARWRQALELMAITWLKEANISYELDNSKQRGPQMQRDIYGNFFYFNQPPLRTTNARLTPISINDLLKVRPSDDWLANIDVSLRPKFDMILAQLYLKVQEEDRALPYIEKLSQPYPRETKTLVEEFLRVWTQNHDPNSAGRRSNYYSMMYGYESRAESIPLTRSKQQRNLAELAALLPKLQALQAEPLDQKLISNAFFSCHSTAEVYRIEQIEKILGPFEDVKPRIVTSIAQRMRSNLAGLWRDANVQKQSKTKRNNKDIQQEVLRGYEVAKRVLQRGLQANPDDWSLAVAMASLQHDENNYKSDLENTSEFSPRQKAAMAGFRRAAEQYIGSIEDKEEKDYSIEAFTSWYYAGLGAVDLGLIDEKRLNDPKQPPQIRELIEGMPAAQAEWHMNSFSNSLFSRMNSVKPQIKHRYLAAGFEIVGDNERAAEARRVFDYYADLVSEIKLDAQVDGNDRVGESAFGLYVNLLHTKEIERESGGFGKYLQNQNSGIGFAYNFGRPTEDYRDKFEDALRQTLAEHFEVLSVTFQQPSVKSSPVKKDGWRYTPYAYVLLKARGKHVDKIPPLKMDLDFLDTSGYAILPIESPAIPIDAANRVERPYGNIRITQILDERQADQGELILEIKGLANGLVPDLDSILEVSPTGFTVTSVEEDGVSVSKFDEEAEGNQVLSQRTWLVTLNSTEDAPRQTELFEFPTPTIEPTEIVFQRYVDADLAEVEPTILLENRYGSSNRLVFWSLAGLGLVVVTVLLIVLIRFAMKTESQAPLENGLPEDASPFVVISMLQDIQRNNGLSETQKKELDQSIHRLEKHYFGVERDDAGEPDLQVEAEKWTHLAKR